MVSYVHIVLPVSVVDALIDYAEVVMVYDYCLSHTDEILVGGNPAQDLIHAHLIPESTPVPGMRMRQRQVSMAKLVKMSRT